MAATGVVLAYPSHHLLGVLDEPSAVPPALEALVAAGIDPAAVHVLDLADGQRDLGSLGQRPGIGARLLQLIRFATMDQAPDLRVYQAAIADGRAVIAVRVGDRTEVLRARAALEGAGAHFLNHYGRFTTEELVRWRGPELDLPGYLRR
jgi:hypothetical protein